MTSAHTNIRQHIVHDMSGHIASELTTAFRLHAKQLHLAGVTSAEGMAISAIVGKRFLIASLGGAALLSGKQNPLDTFDQLIAAVVADIALNREVIGRTMRETAEVGR